ncbi:MAG: energy transducer TonB [Bacteroidota bacterium]
MKKIYLAILQLTIFASLHAQADVVKDSLSKKNIPEDSIFIAPAVEAYFHGGAHEWGMYLMRNLVYPYDAQVKRIQGSVTVVFTVEKNGRLHDVHAVGGPEPLQREAIRLIKDSPRWIPAMQDGQKVRAYKTQNVTFKLAD